MKISAFAVSWKLGGLQGYGIDCSNRVLHSMCLTHLIQITLAYKSFVLGPFNLGRFGIIVGWIAAVWVVAIPILSSLMIAYPISSPTLNYTPVAVGRLMLFTISSWIFNAGHWFKGPVTNIEI